MTSAGAGSLGAVSADGRRRHRAGDDSEDPRDPRSLAGDNSARQGGGASIYTRELVELIFVQPYSRIGNLVDAGIAKRQTASEYLKQLCAIGVLEERKAGRDKLFVYPKLIALLTSDDHTCGAYPS